MIPILLCLTGIAILLAVLYAWLSRIAIQFIFHPVRSFLPISPDLELFFLPLPGGQKIQAGWIAPAPGKPVLLFFHGNGGNISHFEPFALRYRAHGYGVLLFDYRGFGKSSGTTSEQNAYQDGVAALRYLLEHKQLRPEQIVLWGYSLGNAVALQTALNFTELPFKAVVLQSPFTSTPDMGVYRAAPKNYPKKCPALRLFLRLLLWDKQLNNKQKIGTITRPLLIGYSKQDQTVPWQMSRELALLAPRHTRVFVSDQGLHNEFAWFEGTATAFLNSLP